MKSKVVESRGPVIFPAEAEWVRLAGVGFPLWGGYPQPEWAGRSDAVRESGGRSRAFGFSERHLQAVWFDPAWRPAELVTSSGERVVVEFPGTWNLEAGPDFLGASVRVGPDERRMTCDVEVHVSPSDWLRHGHRYDPRYRNVRLHVTYFEGELPEDELPSGALQAALRPVLKRDPSFAFEHIDVSAYPYGVRADLPPCRVELSRWPVEAKAEILASAGHERLRRKAIRLASAVAEKGMEQAFYQAFLSALGYQHNRRPFREMAERLPVDRLRAAAAGRFLHAYAILAGVSGLLPDLVDPAWDEPTRDFVRGLWDIWWKERERFPRPLARTAWRLSSLRPLNHPLRRMAAAAWFFTRETTVETAMARWGAVGPDGLVTALTRDLEPPDVSYWSHRLSLGGAPRARRVAILGTDRVESIAINLVIPLAATHVGTPLRPVDLLEALRPEPFSQPMKQAAHYLFGPDAPSVLFKSTVRRQGLLQIFQDFCLQDRSRCASCPLPPHLARARGSVPA